MWLGSVGENCELCDPAEEAPESIGIIKTNQGELWGHLLYGTNILFLISGWASIGKLGDSKTLKRESTVRSMLMTLFHKKTFVLLMRYVKEYFLKLQSYFKFSCDDEYISYPDKSPKCWGMSHLLLVFNFSVRGFCYISASKVEKCIRNMFFVCPSTQPWTSNFFVYLQYFCSTSEGKRNSVMIVSSMQNYLFVSTNSPINMLCTHLLCTVLKAWDSYLKCFLKVLHSEVGVSCLRMWPTFGDFCIQLIL